MYIHYHLFTKFNFKVAIISMYPKPPYFCSSFLVVVLTSKYFQILFSMEPILYLAHIKILTCGSLDQNNWDLAGEIWLRRKQDVHAHILLKALCHYIVPCATINRNPPS